MSRERGPVMHRCVTLVLVGWLLSAACGIPRADEEKIRAWLLCDDCLHGERASVVALGDRATPNLADALHGPSEGRLEIVRERITLSYLPVDTNVTQDMYVTRLLSNYVARHQSRAASALGGIATSRAVQVLREALRSAEERNYRADVVRAIETALAEASNAAFPGALSDTAAAFGDTISVSQGGGLAWDSATTSVILHGGPFPGDLVVEGSRTDTSLSFLAIGRAGRYALSVTGLGPSRVAQTVPLRITHLRYSPHPPESAVVVQAQELPRTFFLALQPRPRYRADFYRFQTGSSVLPLTAAIDATGMEPVRMQWFRCGLGAPVVMLGSTSSLSGKIVNQRRLPVRGASVAVGSVSGITDGTGAFALTGLLAPTRTGVLNLRVSGRGLRTQVHRIQAGVDSVEIAAVRTNAGPVGARSRHASSVRVAPSSCWLLGVALPGGRGPRIMRLRLTSP